MIVCQTNITEAQLKRVPLVRPQHARSFWQGIKHSDLVDTIQEAVENRGWRVSSTAFSLSNDKGDLAGAFSLRVPDIKMPDDQNLELGFLTSNLMRRKLKLVVGSRVLVCNNGCVTGDIVLCKKHTNRFDLGESLTEALDEYHTKALEIPRRAEELKQYELEVPEVEHLLVETGRRGIMPWSLIGQVDKEYRTPSFNYDTRKEHNTSWDLLNAFTHIVKKQPPLGQMDQINEFRAMLPTGRN